MTTECQHDWCYSQNLLLSYPPQQNRICRKCGKKEQVVIGEFQQRNEYEELDRQFHGTT